MEYDVEAPFQFHIQRFTTLQDKSLRNIGKINNYQFPKKSNYQFNKN